MKALVGFVAGMLVGILLSTLAHADTSDDHFWIQRNPKYVERWHHQTHCCGPSHCRPLPKLEGMTVTPMPNGDWQVAGGRLYKPEVVPAADVYPVEPEGGEQIWMCLWQGGPDGQSVACLFIPKPEG